MGLDVVALDQAMRVQVLADVDTLSESALQTLAVAYRSFEADEDSQGTGALEHNLVFVSTVGIIDPPRQEAATAIAEAAGAASA